MRTGDNAHTDTDSGATGDRHTGEVRRVRTAFIPVSCRCRKCRRVYVEWCESSDIGGIVPSNIANAPCDLCYAPKMSDSERIEFVRLMMKRRRAMAKAYPNAITDFLDSVHKAMFIRGDDCYTATEEADIALLSSARADRTSA